MSWSPWTVDSSGVFSDSPNYTASGTYTPAFPNVPALPGVPPLARLAQTALLPGGTLGAVGATEALASALGLAGVTAFGNRLYSSLLLDSLSAGPLPQYAYLDATSSKPVLTPDSTLELDFEADSDIMSHPIEQGQFASYNRQQDAKSIRLMLACGGQGAMTRSTFLSTLEGLKEGAQLIMISTPDASYRNMALKGYGYRKTAERGAVTIWADTQWLEARSTGVTVSAMPTTQPQGAVTTDLGALQPQTPTSAQAAAIGSPPTPPTPLPARLIEEMPGSGDAF